MIYNLVSVNHDIRFGTVNMQVLCFLFKCFVIIQGKFCSFTGSSTFSGRLLKQDI